MKVRGHVYCNQVDTPEQAWPFRVDGLMSFQFATIDMHWDLVRRTVSSIPAATRSTPATAASAAT